MQLIFANIQLSWDINTTQISLALHPSGVAESTTGFGWGRLKAGKSPLLGDK